MTLILTGVISPVQLASGLMKLDLEVGGAVDMEQTPIYVVFTIPLNWTGYIIKTNDLQACKFCNVIQLCNSSR